MKRFKTTLNEDLLPGQQERQNMGQKVKQGWQNFQDQGGVNTVIGGTIAGMGGRGGGLLGMAKRFLTPKPDPNRPPVETNPSIGQIKAAGPKTKIFDPYAGSGSYGRVIIKDRPPNPDGSPPGYDMHYSPSSSSVHEWMAQDVGMSPKDLHDSLVGRLFHRPSKNPGEPGKWSMDWTTGDRTQPYAPPTGQPEHPGISTLRKFGFEDEPFSTFREGGAMPNEQEQQPKQSIGDQVRDRLNDPGAGFGTLGSDLVEPIKNKVIDAYHGMQDHFSKLNQQMHQQWWQKMRPSDNVIDRRAERPFNPNLDFRLPNEKESGKLKEDLNEISQQHITDYIANAIPDYGNKRVNNNSFKAMKRHRGMTIAAAKLPFAPDNPNYVKNKEAERKIKNFKPYYHGERKNPDPQPESGNDNLAQKVHQGWEDFKNAGGISTVATANIKGGTLGLIKNAAKALKNNPKLVSQPESGKKLKENIVIAFCRMNPFTKGHQKLIEKVRNLGELLNADHEIILTRSHDKINNPLSLNEKLSYARRFFPEVKFTGTTEEAPTILFQLERLREEGYENITIVAGSDRINSFENLINEYNIPNVLVLSAGNRTDDELTASKLREAAKIGDFFTFKSGVPSHLSEDDAMDLYLATRKGLQLEGYNKYNEEELMRKPLREHIRKAVIYSRHTAKLKEDITLPAALLAAKTKFILNPVDSTAKALGGLAALKYLLTPPSPTAAPPLTAFLYPEKGKDREIPDLKNKKITINITTSGTGK